MRIRYESWAMFVPVQQNRTRQTVPAQSGKRGIGTIFGSFKVNVYYVNEACGICDFMKSTKQLAGRCARLIHGEMAILGQSEDGGFLLVYYFNLCSN